MEGSRRPYSGRPDRTPRGAPEGQRSTLSAASPRISRQTISTMKGDDESKYSRDLPQSAIALGVKPADQSSPLRGMSAPVIAPWSSNLRLGADPLSAEGSTRVQSAKQGPNRTVQASATGLPSVHRRVISTSRFSETATLGTNVPTALFQTTTNATLEQESPTGTSSRFRVVDGEKYLTSLRDTTTTQTLPHDTDVYTETATRPQTSLQLDPAVRQSLQETDREGNALLFADGMTLHQVRAFLEVHGFLHVTPRYNVERVNAHNFYDLVVVETPGSGGGLVWQRKFGGNTECFTLAPEQLVQLSLDGALITAAPSGTFGERFQEILSLEDLVIEREMSESVRRLKYFKYYRESRIFGAWKDYLRTSRIRRTITTLSVNSLFSHARLLKTIQLIRRTSVDLADNTEIFCFSEPGCQNASDFLKMQIETVNTTGERINSVYHGVAKSIEECHALMTSDEYLRDEVASVQALHPYLPAEKMGIDVNWSESRAMGSIRDRMHRKFERILYVAHFMLQHAISIVLQRFWVRMMLHVRGIAHVNRIEFTKALGYWSIAEARADVPSPPQIIDTVDAIADEEDPFADVRESSPSSMALAALFFGDWNKNDGSYDVSNEWEKTGSHVSLMVSLCLDNDMVSDTQFFRIGNFNRFKVRVLPGKYPFIDMMHSLCAKLGILLEKLPNLREHSIISSSDMVYVDDSTLLSVTEIEPFSTSLSSGYFSYLHLNNAIAATGGIDSALEYLRVGLNAYDEATDMDAQMTKLQESFRKLHAINAETLAQHVQRSLVVTKIVAILGEPEVANDVSRSISRDRGRYMQVVRAVEALESVRDSLVRYKNVKHPTGFITSFETVVEQLERLTDFVEYKLFSRLPSVYEMRAKNFKACLASLSESFSGDIAEFRSQIALLRKLKNFELAKQAFDLEVEVNEGLYNLIHEYRGSERFSRSSNRSLSSSVDIEHINAQYKQARLKLSDSINRGKALLMGMLGPIKSGVLDRRKELHNHVSELMVEIAGRDPNNTSQATEMALREAREEAEKTRSMDSRLNLGNLEECGQRITSLRGEMKEIVDTQIVLLDAHDVIGSAAPVLLPSEIDPFTDMALLETTFANKYSAWNSINVAQTIKRQILASKLKDLDLGKLNEKLGMLFATYEYLADRLDDGPKTLPLLKDCIFELKPKIEVVSYFMSACLRSRHWRWLNSHVFQPCDLKLEFSDVGGARISVLDMSGDRVNYLGEISRLHVTDIAYRGIDRFLPEIRRITADAAIENMIEETLTCIAGVIERAKVSLSLNWLKEPRMREKMSFDLSQSINLQQLSTLFRYCHKTILVLLNTSHDMTLTFHNERLQEMGALVKKMELFVDNLYEIQYKWISVFHFVKFSAKGEADRDSARLFQMSSEDMKKIEMALNQNSCSMYQVCRTQGDNQINAAVVIENLSSIMEDSQGHIQSLLDAYPRFSLLSYNKFSILVKAWLVGPMSNLDLVSECLADMFEGVGKLRIGFSASQRRFFASGFVSHDHLEVVEFAENVPFTPRIDEFFFNFEMQLRSKLAVAIDLIMVNRVQKLESMLAETKLEFLLKNVKLMFAQRVAQLISKSSDEIPNQAFVLTNACAFCEDLWFCLGHPIGSTVVSCRELGDTSTLQDRWRILLGHLLSECKDNVAMYLGLLRNRSTGNFKMKARKARALISALFLQEVSYVRLLNVLATYKLRESAGEYWAGRYQLLYIFDKTERYEVSPFDVTLGCVTVPYGLEYHGGLVRTLTDEQVDRALQMVLGSASCQRATVFVSREDDDRAAQSCEIDGEYAVSCRDLASALGRIFTPLSSIESKSCVQMFLARLLYLNAFGCTDFTVFSISSIQIYMEVLDSCWAALRDQNFAQFQEWLKYPLRSGRISTDYQKKKSIANLQKLRDSVLFMMKHNVYSGIMLVGVASETRNKDMKALEYISRSNLNLVSMPHSKPLYDLGILLSIQGYIFGMEIQSVFQKAMLTMFQKYGENEGTIHKLCCSSAIRKLAANAGRALLVRLATDVNEEVGQAAILYRARLEMECFAATQWEQVLLIGDVFDSSVEELKRTLFQALQKRFDTMYPKNTPKADRRPLVNVIGSNSITLSQDTKRDLTQCARELGAVPGQAFLEAGARLWSLLSEGSHCLVLLSGSTSCGKTSLRNTVLNVIRKIGAPTSDIHANGDALHDMRATNKLLALAERWLARTRHHKIKEEAAARVASAAAAAAAAATTTTTSTTSTTTTAAAAALDTEGDVNVDDGGEFDPDETNIEQPDEDAFQTHHIHTNRVVHSTVIYHSSLSTAHLLGTFSNEGTWKDGILLRKLREIDILDSKKNSEPNAAMKHNKDLHCIILDGPLNCKIEQLFAASHLHIPAASVLRNESNNDRIILPSGELYKLSGNIVILMETSDVTNASPTLLVHTPRVHMSVNENVLLAQICSVWVASLRNWMGHFHAYADVLNFIESLLRTSRFIHDIISYDELDSHALKVSRISTFLRLLEENLVKIHQYTISDATFVKSDEDEDDDDDDSDGSSSEDDRSVNGLYKNIGLQAERKMKAKFERDQFTKRVMTLHPKAKDMLMSRVKIAIAYCATWGLGGAANASNKRKFFDTVVRDAIDKYIGSECNIDDTDDINIFDLVLNIESSRMLPALDESFCASHYGVPKGLADVKIKVNSPDDSSRINFRTISNVAVESALRLLLGAGAHTLLIGPRSCGKTRLITDILTDLRRNTPTPEQVRQNIVKNLLKIVTDVKYNESVGAALTLMQNVLKQLETVSPVHDDQTNFLECWQVVQTQLLGLLTKGARAHCSGKTVFSTSTTMRTTDTADELRTWIGREFSSEVPHVLETPRYSHGLAFVDDLHICMVGQDSSSESIGFNSSDNRPESMLKGMLDQTPLFGIRKNLSPLPAGSPYGGKPDGTMARQMYGIPIIHRPILTDPRDRIMEPDDFQMQRVGIFGAATVDVKEISESSRFRQILKNLNIIGVPPFETDELHVSLICGAVETMSYSLQKINSNMAEVLRPEISELSQVVISCCTKMISSSDSSTTTSLEKSARNLVALEMSLVTRFCAALAHGATCVSNKGALLELYTHEFSRHFLDPLPDGTQRDRFITLYKSHLNMLDLGEWYISDKFIKNLADRIGESHDPVWAPSAPFSCYPSPLSDKTTDECNEQNHTEFEKRMTYIPISFDAQKTENWRASLRLQDRRGGVGVIFPDDDLSNDEVPRYLRVSLNNLPGDAIPQALFYESGISMLLRIVRIISTMEGHVLLSGFYGTARLAALRLTAKILDKELKVFDVKEMPSAVTTSSSLEVNLSLDLKKFLKTVIFRVAGFEEILVSDDSMEPTERSRVSYSKSRGHSTMLVIQGGQKTSRSDRQMILNIMDYENSTSLFADDEILAMSEALRESGAGANEPDMSSEPVVNDAKSDSTNVVANKDAKDRRQDDSELLTGYSFQWVKRHLQESVASKICIVLDADMPRSLELTAETPAIVDAALALTPLQRTMPLRSDKRFNPLTSKADCVDKVVLENLFVSPNQVLQPGKSENEDLQVHTTSSNQPLPDVKSSSALFTCPILGPMLGRRFHALWWDIDGVDAVCGISHNILSDHGAFEKLRHSSPSASLTLRSSSIGEFYESDLAGIDKNGSALRKGNIDREVAQALANIHDTKSALNSLQMNIFVDCHTNPSDLVDFTCSFSSTGIFDSFAVKSNAPVGFDSVDEELRIAFTRMMREAKETLPELLCLVSVSDAIFLSEPVIRAGPEKLTEMACVIVHELIKATLKVFLVKKSQLITVMTGLEEVLDVANRRSHFEGSLEAQRDEIKHVVHDKTLEKQKVEKDIENAEWTHSMTPNCEEESMLIEDALSTKVCTDTSLRHSKKVLASQRRRLNGAEEIEWQSLATMYTVSPSYELTLLMRAIMLAIDYEPPRFLLAKTQTELTREQMTDLEVQRHGVMMIYSKQLNHKLQHLHTQNLRATQVSQLTRMLTDLEILTQSETDDGDESDDENLDEEDFDDDENVPDEVEFALSEGQRPGVAGVDGIDGMQELPEVSPVDAVTKPVLVSSVPRKLRNVLNAIVQRYHAFQWEKKNSLKLSAIDYSLPVLKEENSVRLQELREGYLRHLEIVCDQLHRASQQSVKLRFKLEVMTHLHHNFAETVRAVNAVKKQVSAELEQIDNVLTNAVGDACVAAATLVRVAWLPEQVRQECMGQFRDHMISQGKRVSDTPFVLGCFVDRQQMQGWWASEVDAFPRDPTIINALHLTTLSPFYTLLIDPEGTAEEVLYKHIPQDSEAFVESASKFSVMKLEAVVEKAAKLRGDEASVCVIITDVQAGASNDLLAFLAAELHVKTKTEVCSNDEGGEVQSEHFHDVVDPSWKRTVRHNDLVALYNPALGSSNPCGDKEASTCIKLCRIRVYLISSKAPTMDSAGRCSPLPTSCLKNINLVQWPTSTQRCHYVESKPVSNALGKSYVANSMLRSKLSSPLVDKVSDDNARHIKATSRGFLELTEGLYHIQNHLITEIYTWMNLERPETFLPFSIEEIVFQPAIPLGFLISAACMKSVSTNAYEQYRLSLELDVFKSEERELLEYRRSLADVFSMSIDFIALCGSFLPDGILTPHALSTRILCEKGVLRAISKASTDGLLRSVPESLWQAHKVLNGIKLFQRLFRQVYRGVPSFSFSRLEALAPTDGATSAESQNLEHDVVSTDHEGAAVDEDGTNHGDEFKGDFSKDRNLSAAHASIQKWSRIGIQTRILMTHGKSSHRVVGITASQRKEAKAVMSFMTVHLRGYFLRQMVEYVQNQVQPGLEWIIKLTLLFAALLQSTDREGAVPVEELRTLYKFICKSVGDESLSFSHYVAFKREFHTGDHQIQSHATIHHAQRQNTSTSASTPLTADNTAGEDKKLRWVFRGSGEVDGLEVNRNSPRWKIQGLSISEEDHAHSRSDCTMSDLGCSKLEVQSKEFRPKARQGDAFEMGWLQTLGVKLFAAAGVKAARALGASSDVVKVLSKSSRASIKASSTRLNHDVPKRPQSRLTVNKQSSARKTRLSRLSSASMEFVPQSTSSRMARVSANTNMHLETLLDSESARANFHMLNAHPSHLSVFKGMAHGVSEKLDEFLEWKKGVLLLSKLDTLHLEEDKMIEMLEKTTPPLFKDDDDDDDDDDDEEEGVDEGSWLKGAELTVVQSLLLGEAVAPGSSGNIAALLFSAIVTYLEDGGRIVQHVDEVRGPEEFFGEENNGSSSADENSESGEEDAFDEGTSFADLIRTKKKGGMGFNTSSGIAVWNSWTKLCKVISGEGEAFGPVLNEKYSKCSENVMMCRDYEDWESVLLDVLSQEYEVDRFAFVKRLADSMKNAQTCAFLTTETASAQGFALSRRVRDFNTSSHMSHTVPIVALSEKLRSPKLGPSEKQGAYAAALSNIKSKIDGGAKQILLENSNLIDTSSGLVVTALGKSGTIGSRKGNKKSLEEQLVVEKGSKTISRSEARRISLRNAVYMEKKKEVQMAIIFSTTWGSKLLGAGPSFNVASVDYAWLPRFFAADVISHQVGSSHAFQTRVNGLPPSGSESRGMLAEELQNTYLWVVTAVKMLSRSCIAPHLRERIRNSSDVQIRATACVLTLWRLTHYLRAFTSAELGLPPHWSDTSNTVSLWQLVRLIIKISDILAQQWKLPPKYSGNQGKSSSTAQRGSRKSVRSRGRSSSMQRTSNRVTSFRISRKGSLGEVASDDTYGEVVVLSQQRMLQNVSYSKAVAKCIESLDYGIRFSAAEVENLEAIALTSDVPKLDRRGSIKAGRAAIQRRSVLGALENELDSTGKASSPRRLTHAGRRNSQASRRASISKASQQNNSDIAKDGALSDRKVWLHSSHTPVTPRHGTVEDLDLSSVALANSPFLGDRTDRSSSEKKKIETAGVSTNMRRKLGATEVMNGDFAKDPSRLASYRKKKADEQSKLEDSIRELLDNISSVDRFNDRNALKSAAEKPTTSANVSAMKSSSGIKQPREDFVADDFVSERTKVLAGLFLAELCPQLSFLPPEDKQRLYTLYVQEQPGKSSKGRPSSALAEPQKRTSVRRTTEVSGAIGASMPAISIVDKEDMANSRISDIETEILDLPPLDPSLNDICMDGMNGSDIILFMVEWAVAEILRQNEE